MEISGKKVLVTGAGGFIGSHLTEELVASGCQVRAFVHYNSFNSWGWLDTLHGELFDHVEVFQGDIRDPNGVLEAMKDVKVVFHLAALIGIPYSYHSPDAYVDTNIRGTLNVLQAARRLGIERVLHTSTSEIYGTAQFVPITEEHPVNPQSPYAATKSGADFLALSFYRSFGLPVVVIRPFNTYGPRQSARAIIPTIITQLLAGKHHISLGSLFPTRDFTFVKDTVKGFVRAAKNENAVGEVINLGNGQEISIGNLVQKIAELTGTQVTVQSDNVRQRPEKSEVERLLASSQKAKKLLDWFPMTSLDNGLIETIKWYEENRHLKIFKTGIYNI